MVKFAAGKTYETRSICDYDCVISVKIISRTEKSVKAQVRGDVKTFRVKADYNGNECFMPWGSYSMAPVISADEVA